MHCVAFQGTSERFPPIGPGTDDVRERAQWRSIDKHLATWTKPPAAADATRGRAQRSSL